MRICSTYTRNSRNLGEQYELVLCIGLLTWLTATGHSVRRHVIAAKASLEFEPHLGKFVVRSAPEGHQAAAEFDMLDISEQPKNSILLAQEASESLRDNLWDKSALERILNGIANSLSESGQGECLADLLKPSERSPAADPLVEFAPALIP